MGGAGREGPDAIRSREGGDSEVRSGQRRRVCPLSPTLPLSNLSLRLPSLPRLARWPHRGAGHKPRAQRNAPPVRGADRMHQPARARHTVCARKVGGKGRGVVVEGVPSRVEQHRLHSAELSERGSAAAGGEAACCAPCRRWAERPRAGTPPPSHPPCRALAPAPRQRPLPKASSAMPRRLPLTTRSRLQQLRLRLPLRRHLALAG